MKFAQMIQTLRSGGASEDLEIAIAEMIAKVAETGKGGSITLKLDFKPVPRTNQLFVTDTINSKEPTVPVADTHFFYDRNFHLTRNDPGQSTLDLMGDREAEAR